MGYRMHQLISTTGPVADLPRSTRNNIHGTIIRGRKWLVVGAVSEQRIRNEGTRAIHITDLTAIPTVHDIGCTECPATTVLAVVSIDEWRPLILVTVAGQHEVHSIRLQQRHQEFAHLDMLAFCIRIMRALRIGSVVKEGDDPVLVADLEIGLEPVIHPAPTRSIIVVPIGLRIQTDEVDVRPVEAVV